MPELRLTLLLVGLMFLIGLAWWEMRRPHQARGSELPRPTPDPPERAPERSADWDTPALELPRMSARDPEAQLPVVELEPLHFAALEAQAHSSPVADDPGDIAADAEQGGGELAPDMGGMDGLLAELSANQVPDPPISDITESFREGAAGDESFLVDSVTVRTIDATWAQSDASPSPEAAPEAAPAPRAPLEAAPAAQIAPESVVVDWPAPDAGKVLAVRLVSSGEKFSGRAVRMALAAEGFVLGKFAIFHKPGPDGRALLSIASLNKPGTFDTHSIDLQRYSGLNLFTVLPGPVPGLEAVEEMLECAQVLAQRLRGTLQDDHGAPLSLAGTALMRSAAAAASP